MKRLTHLLESIMAANGTVEQVVKANSNLTAEFGKKKL